jgi:hypothetical protein
VQLGRRSAAIAFERLGGAAGVIAPFLRLKRLGCPISPKSVYSAHDQSLENYLLYSRHGWRGPPLKQYFLVATSNQSDALKALRYRRPDVEASQLTVAGETNTDNFEWQWLDLREGQILVLEAVS